jgi:hypothetical protein
MIDFLPVELHISYGQREHHAKWPRPLTERCAHQSAIGQSTAEERSASSSEGQYPLPRKPNSQKNDMMVM